MLEANQLKSPPAGSYLTPAAVAGEVELAPSCELTAVELNGGAVVVAAHVAGTVTEVVVVPIAPGAVTVAVPKGLPFESQYTTKISPVPTGGAGGGAGITVAVAVAVGTVTVIGGGGGIVVVGTTRLPVMVGTA